MTQTSVSNDTETQGSAATFIIGSYNDFRPTDAGKTPVLNPFALTHDDVLQLQDPTGSEVLSFSGTNNVVNAVSGTSTIFATAGGDLYNGSTTRHSNVVFVGGTGSNPRPRKATSSLLKTWQALATPR